MLAQELVEWRGEIRRFVDRELIPLEDKLPLAPEKIDELQHKARGAGLWMLDVPEDLGGQGLGFLPLYVFWREISRTPAVPARDHFIFGPAVGPILLALDEDQRKDYLFPVIEGRKKTCFAQTEPDAGSDPARMRTRAVRVEGGYRITGVKRFITGARQADFAQVIAVTDPEKGARGGISCFLIDMNLPGVSVTAHYQTMMGEAPSEIVFEDVLVPEICRVGAEGEGFKLAQGWLTLGRIRHGAHGCGVADRCLEITKDYIKQRQTFGAPLASRQGVQWMIADCEIELHAAAMMLEDAAARLDAGEPARIETFMVKIFGDEMGFRVADRCMQLNGGMGLTSDLPIEKLWRDARSFMITEGPTEVLRTALAAQLLR